MCWADAGKQVASSISTALGYPTPLLAREVVILSRGISFRGPHLGCTTHSRQAPNNSTQMGQAEDRHETRDCTCGVVVCC